MSSPGSPTRAGGRRIQALVKRVATGGDTRHLTRGLSLLLGVGDPPESHGSRGTEDALAAARTVLEGLARERPVVVLLDDLHWADPAVVDALASVGDHPWTGPILMVGLTRPESALRRAPVARIELDAIPEDAMGELASLALGQTSFTPALRRIVTRAGGNPLFLEESLSMLVEAGALVSTTSGWIVADPAMLDRVPTTVRAMIAARLDGCHRTRSGCSNAPRSPARSRGTGSSTGLRPASKFEPPFAAWSRETSFADAADRTPRGRPSSSSSTP